MYADYAKISQEFDSGKRSHNEDSCSSWSNQELAFKSFEEAREQYFAAHDNLGVALNDMFPSLRKETKGCVTKAIRLIRNQLNSSPNY